METRVSGCGSKACTLEVPKSPSSPCRRQLPQRLDHVDWRFADRFAQFPNAFVKRLPLGCEELQQFVARKLRLQFPRAIAILRGTTAAACGSPGLVGGRFQQVFGCIGLSAINSTAFRKTVEKTGSLPDRSDQSADCWIVTEILYAMPLSRIDPRALWLAIKDWRNQASDAVIIRRN
jgi:hypothetical protein